MNSLKKRYYCPLVLILIVLLSRTPPAVAITIDELADICETMESAYKDITVEYEWGVDPPPAIEDIAGKNMSMIIGPEKSTWSSKRPFSEIFLSIEQGTFINSKGDSYESTTMRSYDGKTARHLTTGGLSPTGEQANISLGTITESTRFKPPPNITPISFSVLRLGNVDNEKRPLSERLRKSDFVRLNDNLEKINGFNTVCAELLWDAPSTPSLHKQQAELRIYFSMDHGYTPIKYDYMSPTKAGPKLNYSVNVTSLEKVSDNLWFPSEGSLGDNPTNTYRATKITVNQGLKDEDFDIEFPPGTRITNEISGLSYVSQTLEGQTGTSLNNEAQMPQPPAEHRKSKRTIIYISIAAVIVLLTALIVKKYFCRTG